MTLSASAQDVRLIATDLDGTLLHNDKSISQRTVAAIERAHRSGLQVVAATGRYLASLPPVLATAGIDYAVTSNGAEGYRLGTKESLFVHPIATETVAAILSYLAEHVPLARCEVAIPGGYTHFAQPGFTDLLTDFERHHFPIDYLELTDLEAIDQPLVKMAVRHPTLPPNVLSDAVLDSGIQGFHSTTSGAPMVEISGAGITKARGIARLAGFLGLEARQVLSVGDAHNDIEMLGWAGLGVAMANAVPEALAAADHITASNQEDGFAQLIDALLGS